MIWGVFGFPLFLVQHPTVHEVLQLNLLFQAAMFQNPFQRRCHLCRLARLDLAIQ